MSVQVPLAILRCQPIQGIAHICANIFVPVLVQRKTATRVLDEQVQQADFVGAQFGKLGHDVVGDQVAATAARGEREGLLEPGHDVLCFCGGCSCGGRGRGVRGCRGEVKVVRV